MSKYVVKKTGEKRRLKAQRLNKREAGTFKEEQFIHEFTGCLPDTK